VEGRLQDGGRCLQDLPPGLPRQVIRGFQLQKSRASARLFYFPAFIAYTLYYDLEKDLPNALINLSISVICAVCAFMLPHQYFMAENIDEKWFPFISTLNYFLSFAITITFVFFAVFHINKSGRQLVDVWQEAERQRAGVIARYAHGTWSVDNQLRLEK
jgi:hypothetical protein